MAVYYVCTDRDTPAGGIKVIYRHVDLLNRNGIEAYVLHERAPFRCTWFENDTPIAYWLRPGRWRRSTSAAGERLHLTHEPELDLSAEDVLAIPEGFGPGLASIAPGIQKVIFNQGAYRTFHGYPAEIAAAETPYLHPDVLLTIAVSEDNRLYLEKAFPGARVERVHYSYDPARFPYEEPGRRIVSFMPRKSPFDAHQVLLMLRLGGGLSDWEARAIEGATEAETAAALRASSVFLSFGAQEGCPLPPAEAMLSGAVVVGYHGMGGREYFRPEFSYPVPVGDVRAYAETVEDVLRSFERDASTMAVKARAACAHIRETYPPEREEREVVALWRELL